MLAYKLEYLLSMCGMEKEETYEASGRISVMCIPIECLRGEETCIV